MTVGNQSDPIGVAITWTCMHERWEKAQAKIEELEADCTHYREEQLSAAKLFRAGSDKITDLQACIDAAKREYERTEDPRGECHAKSVYDILSGKTERETPK